MNKVGEKRKLNQIRPDKSNLHVNKKQKVSKMDSWRRPPMVTVDPEREDLEFMLTSIDHYTINNCSKKVAIIRMFGTTMKGNSVCCHVRGMKPYFYVDLDTKVNVATADRFRVYLEYRLKKQGIISDICSVKKKTIFGHQAKLEKLAEVVDSDGKCIGRKYVGGHKWYLKITTYCPGDIWALRKIFENGFRCGSIDGKFTTFESNFSFEMRFMVDHNIVGCGWIKLPVGGYHKLRQGSNTTRCQLEVKCEQSWIESDPKRMDIPPLRILSFDIECLGKEGKFPHPDNDKVIQIANVVKIYGQEELLTSNVFTLDTCDDLKEADVFSFQQEAKLLRYWRKFFTVVDPDIVSGYNIKNFDLWYILERAKVLGIDIVNKLGRVNALASTIKEKTFTSAQKGTRITREPSMVGVVLFDMLKYAQDNLRLGGYSLNNVSFKVMNKKKDDVNYAQIGPMQMGTSTTRAVLAHYCYKDALLPIQLMEKLKAVVNYIQTARVTGVPIDFLLTRGQQVRVQMKLYMKCHKEIKQGYIVPVMKPKEEGKFQGATVVEPKAGFYEEPIAALDFAALYPNIMRAHNFCYTTYIFPEHWHLVEKYDYHEVVISEEHVDEDGNTVPRHCERFLKKHVKVGVLYEILCDLLAGRKVAKGQMKDAKNAAKKAKESGDMEEYAKQLSLVDVYDGLQKALKVTCNSVYGFTGAGKGVLPLKAISMSVTAIGRGLIQETSELVERWYKKTRGHKYNAEIVYGDSVIGDEPVLLRDSDKNIHIKTIESLSEQWKEYPGFKVDGDIKRTDKEQSTSEFEAWTSEGWKKIKRVIRHKCNKNIYRINTHTGCVDVTEDHSLLTAEKEILKSGDCKIGTELLQTYPEFENKEEPLSRAQLMELIYETDWNELSPDQQRALIYGFFMGDGSAGKYHTRWGIKYTWAMVNQDLKLLQKFKIICENVFTDNKFKILDCLKSSSVYKLVSSPIKNMADEFRSSVFDSKRCKIVPNEVLNANYDVRKWFFVGLYAADGAKTSCQLTIVQKNKISNAHISFLARSLGWKVSVNSRKDKLKCYQTYYVPKFTKQANKVKKIIDLGKTEQYVYDLEVENGQFQAGIGDIILKNTDSVFVKFGKYKATMTTSRDEILAEVHKLAFDAEKRLNAHFQKTNRPEIEIEYEKVYNKFLLFKKKKYVGLLFEPGKLTPKYIDAKGIEIVRRDNCPYLRTIMQDCVDFIFKENDIVKAKQRVTKAIAAINQGQVNWSQLIISKTLKADNEYKTKNKDGTVAQPHMFVRDKIMKRGNKRVPEPGDRVQYVFTTSDQTKTYTFAEDPEYALEQELPVNVKHYVENCIRKPLTRLFDPIIGETETKRLFTCTKIKNKVSSKSKRGLFAFFTIKKQCIKPWCNGSVAEKSCLCAKHKRSGRIILEGFKVEHKEQKAKSDAVWDTCRNCLGDGRDPLVCSNSFCPIFYDRTQEQRRTDKLNGSMKELLKEVVVIEEKMRDIEDIGNF